MLISIRSCKHIAFLCIISAHFCTKAEQLEKPTKPALEKSIKKNNRVVARPRHQKAERSFFRRGYDRVVSAFEKLIRALGFSKEVKPVSKK